MTRAPVVVLLLVSALPTGAGLAAALHAGLDAAAFERILATPGIGRSIASSIWTGAVATLLALSVSHVAVALAVTGDWRQRLTGLTLPLLALPHLAVGIGLALVLAPSGLLLRLLSPWATGLDLPPDWQTVRDPFGLALIAGLVVKESAFLVMVLFAALAQLPADRLQLQARTLGYGPLKAWFVAVAPLLQQRIRLPLTAVLVFGMTNVEVAIPLGPGLPPTFSVLLWQWFVDPDPAIHAQAYAGTLLLLAITALTIGAAALLARGGRALLHRAAVSGARRAADRHARTLSIAALAAGWIVGLLALAAIVLRATSGAWRFPAVLPDTRSLADWSAVLPAGGDVAATTLILAVATAVTGVLLVLPAAESCRDRRGLRRATGAALFLPLLVPQMTFLFGVQVLLTALHIDGTFAAVLWAHVIFALPYLWGVLAPARAGIDPRFQQAARTLGAGTARTFLSVTLPLLSRPALLALALAFSVSVALYLPTLFAGAGRIPTAATEAAAAAASGSLRLAATHGIQLAGLPLAAFALALGTAAALYRHRRGVPG